MNCKPNDLAMVVEGDFVGYMCKVVSAGPTFTHIASGAVHIGWNVEFPHDMPWTAPEGQPMHTGWLPDAWLRPIRDPGDDARDETLAWLPVPSIERTKEAA